MKYVIQNKVSDQTIVADDYTEMLGMIGEYGVDIGEFVENHSERAFTYKEKVGDLVIIPQYFPKYVYLVQEVGTEECVLCESYTNLVHYFGNQGADIRDFIENKYPGHPTVESDVTITTKDPYHENRVIDEVYHIIPMVKE